jgi:hypothetical protein
MKTSTSLFPFHVQTYLVGDFRSYWIFVRALCLREACQAHCDRCYWLGQRAYSSYSSLHRYVAEQQQARFTTSFLSAHHTMLPWLRRVPLVLLTVQHDFATC